MMIRFHRWRWRVAVLSLAAVIVAAVLWHVGVAARDVPAELLSPRRVRSLTVLDRQGEVLRETAGASGGKERWVKLSQIAAALKRATIAAEDHRFYRHAGVDWVAVGRALWLNLKARRFAFGASTLTMQLARVVEPRGRSLSGKLGEALLAARIEQQLSKEQILEQYLNRVYYGSGAWGVEAAARRYYGKPARALALGEAALLAVLPRNPRRYHLYRHLSRALQRRAYVLRLMQRRGMITEAQRRLALRTPLRLIRKRAAFRAPHFVDYVVTRLPREHRQGAVVRTTLDGPLQSRVEVAVRNHLGRVRPLNVTQAGVVVLRNRDGAVLAMVGSADYFDAGRNGAFNAVTARLRPGSTLKPFVYALALEAGDTPATVAHDVVLPHELNREYTRDVRQHGPARYREALAGSYNLAAVHTLRRVGVPTLVERLRRAGLATLDWPDRSYDLGLAVGYAEVRLFDLAAAFATFGRGGRPLHPRVIRSSVRPDGQRWRSRRRPSPQLFSPQVAYLIYDILQDPDARRPMFGHGVPLYLPFRVALKTGTTRAYTDNWALGTTREYTVGVWAGNFDGSPTYRVMSMRGATPLLRAVFSAIAARFGEPTPPTRPRDLVDATVCAQSGALPGPYCRQHKVDMFVAGTIPEHQCSWHRKVCGKVTTHYPQELHGWLLSKGRLPAPPRCPELARGALRIVYPREGARFILDPYRPREHQQPPLRAFPAHAQPRWTVDGVAAARWKPSPGVHLVRATLGGLSDTVRIHFEE